MASSRILLSSNMGVVRSHRGAYRADGSPDALVRLRAGVYTPADDWRAATPEERVVARARALQLISAGDVVFSHETAAAIHGLPLYRSDPDRVHIIVSTTRPGAAMGTVRHRGELSPEDVVVVQGLHCTSLARTVADMARTATAEQAIVTADAAFRRMSVPRNSVHLSDRAEEFRSAARAIAHRSAHGARRAERVLEFADGRAQLPGESISRIRIAELGFTRVRLQVGVRGPQGQWYWVDFAFDDVEAEGLGEFDGTIKYIDGKMLDGRTTAQVFDAEKQREDWIRGTTQRRFARWGWVHLRTAETLGRRLSAFGIVPPSVS